MNDQRQRGRTTSNSLVNCGILLLTACTVVVLFVGPILVYAGLRAGLSQCRRNNYTDQVTYYRWDCKNYYIPDLVYVSIEAGVAIITGLLLLLGLMKTLRLPILSFLTITTLFMIKGIQKYGKEHPEHGLFLEPITNGGSEYVYVGQVFNLGTNRPEGYNGYNEDVDRFRVVELKGVYTHKRPRRAAIAGYSFIVAGNLVLILVVGIGKIQPMVLPDVGKYKKTVDKFRSHLAGLIAPSTKPLSDDEEAEQSGFIQRELQNV